MERLNYIKVEKVLREKGISLFTPRDFRGIFGVSRDAAKNFINRHSLTGLFLKIKNGLYVFSRNLPSKFVIANHLYQPSYVSFETALAYYNIIPETVYSVISATTRASREFTAGDTQYIYHRVKRELFFGYSGIKKDTKLYLMADPEKALADYLYFVVLKKKTLNDRLQLTAVRRQKLLKVVSLFKKPRLTVLVKSLYDQPRSDRRIY
jgi:predicted transcriptional regulator of viral defense system